MRRTSEERPRVRRVGSPGPSLKRGERGGSGDRTTYSTRNRTMWDRTATAYEDRHRRSLAREGGMAWGAFRIPERDLRLLGPVRGRRVLELGCGAAGWSIALARRGARTVGLDFSAARLEQARAAVERSRARVALVRARAEELPFPDATFDLVLSDYGATTFAPPARTIPEVGRVLRAGGTFAFAHASPLRSITELLRPDRLGRRLLREYFGMDALRLPDSVEFQRSYGEWIALFSSCGLGVDRLVEPRAPRARSGSYLSARDRRWARRWPIESIWKLTKVGPPRPRRDPARGLDARLDRDGTGRRRGARPAGSRGELSRRPS